MQDFAEPPVGSRHIERRRDKIMDKNSIHSSFREKLVEHLFLGELLKLSWAANDCSLEISHPEVDSKGYDLIAEQYGVIRHIQLKSVSGKLKRLNIGLALGDKPSGCVLLMCFNDSTMELGPFYFLGGTPGEPLPEIKNFPVSKNPRSKTKRPNQREVPPSRFSELQTIEDVYAALFGQPRQIVPATQDLAGGETIKPAAKSVPRQSAPANSVGCLCCAYNVPVQKEKICPICRHAFAGEGWGGIDAHWRKRHETDTGILYEDFWDGMCNDHRTRRR